MVSRRTVPFQCLLLLYSAALVAGKEDAEQLDNTVDLCESFGFSKDLKCGMCKRLEEFLSRSTSNDTQQILEECRTCCMPDKETFERAVMYVCSHRLAYDQDFHDFVTRKAQDIKQLKIKKMRGAKPLVQFLQEGETEETSKEFVNIQGWKSDEIRDFLLLKLGAGSSA
mmetsp:Transcript_8778/g.15810  ORF Transcript_8778/g.15810 Transcript_8778/m.15810 type:complete len:169 (-) Transcript_8778:31-537(-)